MVADLMVPADLAVAAIARAAAGDADALPVIVDAHHADMLRIAYVICGDGDLAADAVHSAWPIAWRKLGTVRDPARLRPWLMSGSGVSGPLTIETVDLCASLGFPDIGPSVAWVAKRP
ncbi:MAG: hypothetical protein LH650_03880 [Chloroflexi bacterium]|nr:hypothetical protein [Chloroflexota bacterium]